MEAFRVFSSGIARIFIASCSFIQLVREAHHVLRWLETAKLANLDPQIRFLSSSAHLLSVQVTTFEEVIHPVDHSVHNDSICDVHMSINVSRNN